MSESGALQEQPSTTRTEILRRAELMRSFVRETTQEILTEARLRASDADSSASREAINETAR